MGVSDHGCEYVPGDPHCVVCYERADAVEGSWVELDREVLVVVQSVEVPR